MNASNSNKHREQLMDDVAVKAQKAFADTRFDWARSLGRRRAMVLVTFAVLILYGIGQVYNWPFISLACLIAFMALALLMRVSTRTITDLPDEVVDERMRHVRGGTYRLAFIGVITLMSGYVVLGIANALLAKAGLADRFTVDQLHDVFFAFFFAAMVMPTAIFAWTESHL